MYFFLTFFIFQVGEEEGGEGANPNPKLVSSLGGGYYPLSPPKLKQVWSLGRGEG